MAEQTTREVQIRLTARDAASGVIAQASTKIQGQLGGLQQSFKELKTLTRAGGALYIAGEVAGGLADAIGNAAEEMKGVDVWTKSWVDKLAGGIPILGEAWRLGRNIREMITGEEESAKRRLAAENAINDAWMKRKKLLEGLRERENPRSQADKDRDEIKRKFDPEIDRLQKPLLAQLNAGKISASVYEKMLRDSGAAILIRQRAEAMGIIDRQEQRAGAPLTENFFKSGQAAWSALGFGGKDLSAYEKAIRQQEAGKQFFSLGQLAVKGLGFGDRDLTAYEKAIQLQEENKKKDEAGKQFFAMADSALKGLGFGDRDLTEYEKATRKTAEREQEARSAQLREARFLTGVGARNPLQKPTEETAKNTKATSEAIKMLAQAIRDGTARPFL